jgi:hypothetical protein
MRRGDPANRDGHCVWRAVTRGPLATFLCGVAVAGVTTGSGLLPTNLLAPVVSTLLFVLSLVSALVAWVRCSTDEYRGPPTTCAALVP